MGFPGLGSPMAPTGGAMPTNAKGGLTPTLAQDINSVLPGGSKATGTGTMPERPQDIPLPQSHFAQNLIQSALRPNAKYQQMKEY